VRYSIVTITKNNPEGLRKTQQSVESQTYSDYEWIVIDGERELDNGIYDAMNKGITRAQGEYTIFMNAGDEFASPNILQDLSQYHADFIYGDAIEGGRVKRAKPVSKMKKGMITHHQAMMYRTKILKKLCYDERYNLAADYKLTLQFINLSRCIFYINKNICIFEMGGVSQRHAALSRQQESVIRQELGIFAPLTPYRQWVAQGVKNHVPWLYHGLKRLTE